MNWPEWAGRSFRTQLRGLDPARGDTVIGAFVLARLLGIRLLTLEARVVVHEDDRGGTGPGPLVLAPVPPDRRPPRTQPGRSARSGRAAGSSRTVRRRPTTRLRGAGRTRPAGRDP